jgi:translation initiation factor IF-3
MPGNERHYRINRELTAPRLRLVGGKGEQLGIVTLDDALRRAEEGRMDLVEVAPEADPPVARLMDFGKFRYTQQKHEQAARRRQHVVKIKEVKFHVKIAPHDFQVKVRHAEEFLTKGDKVKLVITFRGREADHADLGMRVLENCVRDLGKVGVVEYRDESEPKYKSIIMTPKAAKPKA